jgi:hypothetical protein
VVLSAGEAMVAVDPDRTAGELLRVCRPGGRIGIVSWTPGGSTARPPRRSRRWDRTVPAP